MASVAPPISRRAKPLSLVPALVDLRYAPAPWSRPSTTRSRRLPRTLAGALAVFVAFVLFRMADLNRARAASAAAAKRTTLAE